MTAAVTASSAIHMSPPLSSQNVGRYVCCLGSVALLSNNTLMGSAILGVSFFARCLWLRESVLWGSSALSEFRTSLFKLLTLWHSVKVKQRHLTLSSY